LSCSFYTAACRDHGEITDEDCARIGLARVHYVLASPLWKERRELLDRAIRAYENEPRRTEMEAKNKTKTGEPGHHAYLVVHADDQQEKQLASVTVLGAPNELEARIAAWRAVRDNGWEPLLVESWDSPLGLAVPVLPRDTLTFVWGSDKDATPPEQAEPAALYFGEIEAWQKAQEMVTQGEKDKKRHKAAIESRLGGSLRGTCYQGSLEIQVSVQARPDVDRLRLEYPEVWKAVKREIPVRKWKWAPAVPQASA